MIKKAITKRLSYTGNSPVGYYVQQLDERDREALKNAKASDFDVRIEKGKFPIP